MSCTFFILAQLFQGGRHPQDTTVHIHFFSENFDQVFGKSRIYFHSRIRYTTVDTNQVLRCQSRSFSRCITSSLGLFICLFAFSGSWNTHFRLSNHLPTTIEKHERTIILIPTRHGHKLFLKVKISISNIFLVQDYIYCVTHHSVARIVDPKTQLNFILFINLSKLTHSSLKIGF